MQTGIKKQTTKTQDTQQIEVVKQDVANSLLQTKSDKKSANPNVRFVCATEKDGVVYITEGWGLTGPAAMRSCARRLARML